MICANCPACGCGIFRLKLSIWDNHRKVQVICAQCGVRVKYKDVERQIDENTLPPVETYESDAAYQEEMRRRRIRGLRRIK